MKIQALVTTLVLGSSTAALAAPHYDHGSVAREPVRTAVAVRPIAREQARPIVREQARPIVREPARPLVRNDIHPIIREGYGRDIDGRRFERERFYHRPIVVLPAPVVVDVPTYVPAPSAFMDGSETIGLGNAIGTGIELNADGGGTYVQSALITYADGNTQSVAIGRELDGASPALELQTDGSPVASVTVYGSGNGVAAFMV
jgi:hypothetical protein